MNKNKLKAIKAGINKKLDKLTKTLDQKVQNIKNLTEEAIKLTEEDYKE